jgi:hypothetical protein
MRASIRNKIACPPEQELSEFGGIRETGLAAPGRLGASTCCSTGTASQPRHGR